MISGLLVFIFKCQAVDLWRHNTKSQEWVTGESLNVGFYPQWLCYSNWESKESECLCIVSGKNQLRVLLGSQGQQVPVLRDVWDNPLYQDLQELPVVNESLSLAFCHDISFIIYRLIRKLHKIQYNNTYGHYLFAKEVNWWTHTHTHKTRFAQ